MKITVKKNDLLDKLRTKLAGLTVDIDRQNLDRKAFLISAEKEVKKKALAALKDSSFNNFTVEITKEEGVIKVRVPLDETNFVPTPSRPYNWENYVEELQKAIGVLELSQDETLVITEKDNYFKYLR